MDEDNEKKVTVWIKVTQKDRDLIQRKAQEARMSISSYVMFLAESRPIFVIDALPKFILELNRVGTNINQIAKVANEQKYANPEFSKMLRENMRVVEDIGHGINQILSEMTSPQGKDDPRSVQQLISDMQRQLDAIMKKIPLDV
jgi:uncharacterized protein (DUF1778 family)